jgi:REP element-mobilizing transposase RayT
VLRVRGDIGRLRRGPIFQAIQKAALVVAECSDFRLIHFSIQHNHLHLIVEASSRAALSAGMNTLAAAAARAINASLGRTGKVFECRYHATAITAPRQARNALAYVLNNWRRHKEDERSLESRLAPIDLAQGEAADQHVRDARPRRAALRRVLNQDPSMP